mgnify:CR=1 FL=1
MKELLDVLNSPNLRQIGHGGSNTPPETRLLLFSLAVSMQARDILELGCDMGFTTRVLATTGANVVGVDNFQDGSRESAYRLTAPYPNCTIVESDAYQYLLGLPCNGFDMVFVDDNHEPSHVGVEAIEIRRIIRPHGIVAFHDTIYDPRLRGVIRGIFSDCEQIEFPAISPLYERDFGITIVRMP